MSCRNPAYLGRDIHRDAVAQAGFRILQEARSEPAWQEAENAAMFRAIRGRAETLGLRHPNLRPLFAAYVEAQAREFRVLEEDVENVTLLLERL